MTNSRLINTVTANRKTPLSDNLTMGHQERLESLLSSMGKVKVAVSGGVDSMTLAYMANHVLEDNATMIHAISPAVPTVATERVKESAKHFGWKLEIVDAREFADESYLRNPVNRCYYCKLNLYETLKQAGIGQVLSGTNIDDLSDFRPGLQAANELQVRHPFVEANMHKSDIRTLASELNLSELAVLPASPCLSSRVETGIEIDAATLKSIDKAEQMIQIRLSPNTVRCRVRNDEIVLELDSLTLEHLNLKQREQLQQEVRNTFQPNVDKPVRFSQYRQGSAFLQETVIRLQENYL